MLSLVAGALPAAAQQRAGTRAALDRVKETFALRVERGGGARSAFAPVLAVSVAPAFEETRATYPAEALAVLLEVFGPSNVRLCEACFSPRVEASPGHLEQTAGLLSIDDAVRLDERLRGAEPAARTAVWLDETPSGVALRFVELATSRVLYAENVDAALSARHRTAASFALAHELDRRTRGESLTHAFVDVIVYPGQHLALDWLEQWGDDNANLSGVSVSAFDPVAGIGAAYFRVIPHAFNVMLGAKVLMSLPTAIINGIQSSQGGDVTSTSLFDPLLTGVLMARFPIGRSNYALAASVSTNGRVGVGLSLVNFSILPFLP